MLSLAIDACIPDGELKALAIYGPRRSGTNYLMYLALLNTLDHYALQMDAVEPNHHFRLIQSGHHEYGSKHSLEDRPLHIKLKPANTNIIIYREDVKTWIYSRYAYQRTFCKPDFKLTDAIISSWIQKEYHSFFAPLQQAPSTNYSLISYESLNPDVARTELRKHGALLTRFPATFDYKTSPGGTASTMKFQPRETKGNIIIDQYFDKNPSAKEFKPEFFIMK